MNKATELVVGAVGGAIASQVLELLIGEAKIVLAFKSVSKELATTMEDLLPVIIKIELLQKLDELKTLKETIHKARVLVKKCSSVKRWELHKKSYYTGKVWKIQKMIVSFCQVQLQLLQHRNQLESMEDIKKLQLLMKKINSNHKFFIKKLDDFMKAIDNIFHIVIKKLNKVSEEVNINHQMVLEKLDLLNPAPVYRDLCSVPKLGKAPVGFDGPLKELKMKLRDDSVESLLVSASPGCGKTKLVTQLCHDEDIRGLFKHIFFYVVSSTPNFKKLVQDLFEHNGYQPTTFENDTQAGVGLGILLEKLKGNGILLVLDDVWSGAESLLEKFLIDIPDLKILVTSRFDFPGFSSTYHLKPLKNEDAKALLIQCASRPDHTSLAEYEELLRKILKQCNGFPLVIKVLGSSLKNRTLTQWKGQVIRWSKGRTVLHANDVLKCLKPSFDALDSQLQRCFLDLGSFLEDQKICASIIVDIWAELYGNRSMTEKEKGIICMSYLQDLANHNLLDLVLLGRKGSEDGFYNEFFVMQHDILRELAIRQSESEATLKRKRVNLEIRGNNFPEWCSNPKRPIINASLLSISTDDLFSSSWVEIDCPNVEALVLNISSSNYALPKFIERMTKLKVVIIINHGFYPVRLSNFSYLRSLPNLKRIRLENVSITFLDILQLQLSSLKKLALFRCRFGKVTHDTKEIDVSIALSSLQEIDIDYCYDLVELPFWVFEAVSLKILSITNCNKLSRLPEAIGKLTKLEVLRLCSCINLFKLPETTAELNNMQFLDISECSKLKKLPLEIGKLHKLKKISMRKSWRYGLPDSMRNLENLEVTCDEETRTILWERLKPKMRNLSVYEEETEHNLNLNSWFGTFPNRA